MGIRNYRTAVPVVAQPGLAKEITLVARRDAMLDLQKLRTIGYCLVFISARCRLVVDNFQRRLFKPLKKCIFVRLLLRRLLHRSASSLGANRNASFTVRRAAAGSIR